MALPILPRLRRRREQPDVAEPTTTAPPAADTPRVRRRPLPPPGRLRREQRAILRVREERLRDLGGLVLEMHRRDAFRADLIEERCLELVGLEERLHELDTLLMAASALRRPARAARCACGAPILFGSTFCASCGRTVSTGAAASCTGCGRPLAADAHFCASCGRSVTELPEVAAPVALPQPARPEE
jgi:hypothetical protein